MDENDEEAPWILMHTHSHSFGSIESNGFVYIFTKNCMSIKMGFHFITSKRNNLGFFCSEMLLFIMLLLLHSSIHFGCDVCVCVCVRCRCRCRCRYVFKPAVDIIQVYSDKASREHYGFFTSVHRMWYFSI